MDNAFKELTIIIVLFEEKKDLLFSCLNNIKNFKINKEPRGKEKPSDHTPIEIELT